MKTKMGKETRKKTIKKKRYISAGLCIVLLISLFTCGGCQKKEEEKEAKKKQIELWHYWDIALVDSSDFQFLHQMKPFADLTDEISELKEYSHYHLVFVHGN